MSLRNTLSIIVVSVFMCFSVEGRAGGLPVFDAAAVANQLTQITHMTTQISHLRSQLDTMNSNLAALTGGRGMGSLASNQDRRYLPDTWSQVASQSGQLASAVQQIANGNAVLTAQQIASLSPQQQATLLQARNLAATQKAIASSAYDNASNRIGTLQSLMNAIDAAPDVKAAQDLQNRIQAEQLMLQNDAIKLSQATASAQAEQKLLEQKREEDRINMFTQARGQRVFIE